MKTWVVAGALVGLLGAFIGLAVLLGVRGMATADAITRDLALAESVHVSKPAATTASSTTAAPPPAPANASPNPSPSADGPAPVSPEALPRALTFHQTNTYNGAIVYVPDGCHDPYDLILHFHGAHPYVRDLVEKANLNAVVAVFNAGNGAEKYSQAYGAGGTLASLLRQVDMATAPLCPGAKLGRVAVMAWSAGYAAAEKLVSHDEDRAKVDAILLADGLHAGFTDRWKRLFAPNALQAFRDFGELAKAGKKLFAITHSSIMTDGYGSTTECSRLLLKALDVPCDSELVSGKSGNFSIEGFEGDDKSAHIRQFRQMDTTLLAKLRARWNAPAGAAE